MKIKQGASIMGLKPEIILGLNIANEVYEKNGFELVITSATGDKHGKHSHHYKGLAADIRTRNVDSSRLLSIYDNLCECLGGEFQCILEQTHIHIEYDPA
jgi:hypothetical protein